MSKVEEKVAVAAAEELTIAEECLIRGAEAGLTKREISALRRELSKASDTQLFRALDGGESFDGSKLIGLLYSLTDQQMAELSWKLKAAAGWD